MSVLDIIVKYHDGLLAGLCVTLRLCAIIWSSGLVFGSLLGAASTKSPYWIGGIGRFFSFALSGVPVLVLLFWLHYPAQAIAGVVVNPFYTAAATLSLINIFAVSDIVRQSLLSFPKQFVDAAKVSGLTPAQTLWHIQIPLLLRQVVPPFMLVQVNMLQATLFASLISVDELFRVVQQINAIEYKPVLVYTALALFFLAICLPMNAIALSLQRRYQRDLSEK